MIVIGPARYFLIRAAAVATGLTEKAIRRKIEEGHWIENKHWRKAPDGHIYIDMKASEQWVESASEARAAPDGDGHAPTPQARQDRAGCVFTRWPRPGPQHDPKRRSAGALRSPRQRLQARLNAQRLRSADP
jgi:hypothetical protein